MNKILELLKFTEKEIAEYEPKFTLLHLDCENDPKEVSYIVAFDINSKTSMAKVYYEEDIFYSRNMLQELKKIVFSHFLEEIKIQLELTYRKEGSSAYHGMISLFLIQEDRYLPLVFWLEVSEMTHLKQYLDLFKDYTTMEDEGFIHLSEFVRDLRMFISRKINSIDLSIV